MKISEVVSVLGTIVIFIAAFGVIPFLVFILFPFLNGFSSEKRLEKFINDQCIQGNEIAIRIKREKLRFYDYSDTNLVRSAIEGNEHAIRALKLDPETKKNKFI